MYWIAICDDIPAACTQVTEMLSQHPRASELKIATFHTSEDLIDSIERGQRYDLLIQDIELPYMNGVALGHFLRQEMKNHDTQILFVSGHTSYAPELFDIHPLNFLQKPLNKDKLLDCVSEALCIMERRQPFYYFTEKRGSFRLPQREIRYFEITGKTVTIHTICDKHSCTKPLSEIEDALQQGIFVRIHHSYLINKDYIRRVHYDSLDLHGGEVLPISQSYRKAVRQELMSLFSKKNRQGDFP